MTTKLDELNALLAKDRTLPAFRNHVDRSGRNHAFLAKKYRGPNPRIRELVALPLNELLKPVQ